MVRIHSQYMKSIGTHKHITTVLTAPVQNTWYTIFQGYNVEVMGLAIQATTTGETIEMRVTIDGLSFACSAGIAVNANEFTALPSYLRCSTLTPYFILSASSANADIGSAPSKNWCFGHNVLIEARKTTANGANNLSTIGVYVQQ